MKANKGPRCSAVSLPLPPEEYLGDGVYASHDGYYIWLDTRAQTPHHRIGLEPAVLARLNRYREMVEKHYIAARAAEAEEKAP